MQPISTPGKIAWYTGTLHESAENKATNDTTSEVHGGTVVNTGTEHYSSVGRANTGLPTCSIAKSTAQSIYH